MSIHKAGLTRLLLFVLIGLSSMGWSCHEQVEQVRDESSLHRWHTVFFKEIDQVAELVGIESLKTVRKNNGDFEIRIWRGFGLSPLEGVVLGYHDGQWSAGHIKADTYKNAEKAEMRKLIPPRSGWEVFWNRLVDRNILTLSNADIGCQSGQLDGISYVVEIKKNHTYRTYMYGHGNCIEAKHMEEIGEIIRQEFETGQEECLPTDWLLCTSSRKSRE